MRMCLILALVCATFSLHAAEEKIRGVLEKTAKPGACAQITDALSDIYYINKTDEAEKAVANFVGKTQKVVITGIVEYKEGDSSLYFNLKAAEAYTPKMPPAPPAAAAPGVTAPLAPTPDAAPQPKAEAKPAPEAKPADGDAKK